MARITYMNSQHSPSLGNGFGMYRDEASLKVTNFGSASQAFSASSPKMEDFMSHSSLTSFGSPPNAYSVHSRPYSISQPAIDGMDYTSRCNASLVHQPSMTPSVDGIDYLSRRNPTAFHQHFLSTYKVYKCKEKRCHDKRQCKYWHSKGDRRRNPFEVPYSPAECTMMVRSCCPEGDLCLRSHNMMERMFHPELYKISMCARGPNGSFCERGDLCAFAHFAEDLRVPLSRASGNAPQAPQTIAQVQEKLLRLVKSHGKEGILSSELPKRYCETYGEKLEPVDEEGNRCRIKDIMVHDNIAVVMHKNVQPKYIYVLSHSGPLRTCVEDLSDLSQHLESPCVSLEHLPIFDDEDTTEYIKTQLDETQHTCDTVESFASLSNHDSAEYWRMKADALEKRCAESQMLNDSFAKAYNSMHAELRGAYEILNAKNKEVAMLQEYVAKASKMHTEVLRLQSQLAAAEAQLKASTQQSEIMTTNSLMESFFVPRAADSTLPTPPGLSPLSHLSGTWPGPTESR